MNKRLIMKASLAIFSMMLLFNLGTFAQSPECSDLTSEQIAEAINDRIKDKYPDLSDGIEVSVENDVATLEGFATTKKLRKKIKEIANKYRKETKCIKKVSDNIKVGVDCSKMTDEEIVNAIYARLKKEYPDLANINLSLEDGVLTIDGWVANQKKKTKIQKIIEEYKKDTDCIKEIVNNLTVGKTIGCSAKQKECNGICIDQSKICHEIPTGN